MRKLLLFLLLASRLEAQSVSTVPPGSSGGGGGTFTGGTITAPILGPTGCATPAYSFDGTPAAGLCLDAGVIALGTAPGSTTHLRIGVGGSQSDLSGGAGGNSATLRLSTAAGNTGSFGVDVSTETLEGGGPGAKSDAFTVRYLAVSSLLPFLAPAGSTAAPSYSFSADPASGMYQAAGVGNLQFSTSNAEQLRLTPTVGYYLTSELRLDNDTKIGWAAGSALAGAADTGLARVSAGLAKVTDGSTGNGDLKVGRLYALSSGANAGILIDAPATAVRSGSTGQFAWAATTDANTASDTGLARSSAGIVKVTDGAAALGDFLTKFVYLSASADVVLSRDSGQTLLVSGNGSSTLGYVLSGVKVEANTGTKSPTVVESGELYTNTGDADGSAVTLPNDPTVGAQYSVAVTVAQTITVSPSAGETLYLNAAACSSITSATIGGAVSIVAATGGSGALWIGTGSSWTCVP
jgi:hypothetical protein